jgi:threonine dehydratase
MLAAYAPATLEEIEAARNRIAGTVIRTAALSGRARTGKIVCVVSGGNIDSAVLRTILAGETP